MVIALPLLVCLVGLVVYLIAKDGKIAEVGRCMFWVGLLVTLYYGGPFFARVR
jgi:hypothetical protein